MSHCYRVPGHVSLEQAATFPTVWLTAGHALFSTGGLSDGETVMIHAAGSEVSVAGIQLAEHAGATVLATAGTDAKCERASTIGADHRARAAHRPFDARRTNRAILEIT